MLKFFLLVLTSYFGIVIGNLISANVKEELKPGRTYFRLLRIILMGLISALFAGQYSNTYLTILFIVLTVIFSILIERKKFSNFLYYSFFSLPINLISDRAVMGIMIFLFGITTSSYNYKEKKSFWKNLIKSVKGTFIFILSSLLIYYFRT